MNERSPTVLGEVLRLLELLDAGTISPTALRDLGESGDLTDCAKIVVAVDGEAEHQSIRASEHQP